jgi:CBS domain-containing protein
MNANTTKQAPAVAAKQAPAVAAKQTYSTKVEGKPVEVAHVLRRRYAVSIDGKAAGYITARDVMYAVGRVETVDSLKALKEMLH